MNFDNHHLVTIAYILSNIVGLLILYAAIKRPKLARLLFVLLFGWASWINYTTAHDQPEVYLVYAQTSAGVYKDFINGWFRGHITLMVSLIAMCQFAIAVGMTLNGLWVRISCIGCILFLIAIAPLGIAAAFPFSLTAAAAAYFIVRKDDKHFLWQYKNHNRLAP